jgi:hypothetical protein
MAYMEFALKKKKKGVEILYCIIIMKIIIKMLDILDQLKKIVAGIEVEDVSIVMHNEIGHAYANFKMHTCMY